MMILFLWHGDMIFKRHTFGSCGPTYIGQFYLIILGLLVRKFIYQLRSIVHGVIKF